jgi:hypothetical protein
VSSLSRPPDQNTTSKSSTDASLFCLRKSIRSTPDHIGASLFLVNRMLPKSLSCSTYHLTPSIMQGANHRSSRAAPRCRQPQIPKSACAQLPHAVSRHLSLRCCIRPTDEQFHIAVPSPDPLHTVSRSPPDPLHTVGRPTVPRVCPPLAACTANASFQFSVAFLKFVSSLCSSSLIHIAHSVRPLCVRQNVYWCFGLVFLHGVHYFNHFGYLAIFIYVSKTAWTEGSGFRYFRQID